MIIVTIWYVCILIYYYVEFVWSNKSTIQYNTINKEEIVYIAYVDVKNVSRYVKILNKYNFYKLAFKKKIFFNYLIK